MTGSWSFPKTPSFPTAPSSERTRRAPQEKPYGARRKTYNLPLLKSCKLLIRRLLLFSVGGIRLAEFALAVGRLSNLIMTEQLSREVDVPTLVRLLKGIDRLPEGATGALVFTSTDAPQGTVLVEDNRVCWAAASNMEHRLTDILRHESDPPLPVETFEAIYDECYRDRIPLGETLVERGLVTPEGLWRGLLKHTAEAICLLATTSSLSPVWASNRQRRYDAQFTFSTPELLSCAGSFGFEEEANEAQHTLREITPREAIGLAYLADRSHELPLAHVAAENWDCQELVDLGKWAREALPDGEDDEETVGVVESAAGPTLRRAWRAGPLIYVRFVGSQELAG